LVSSRILAFVKASDGNQVTAARRPGLISKWNLGIVDWRNNRAGMARLMARRMRRQIMVNNI